MKLVIVGGHLSPALAVIETLPKGIEILFIGRKYTFEGDKTTSLEYNTIKSLGIPFVEISTGRLQRIFTRFTILSLFKIPYGFIQAFFILRKSKPDKVLSFGGYLSIPVGLAAFLLKIPLIIHEQTLEAGLANRILALLARRICISWESSRKYFSKRKTVLTGNPLRRFNIRTRHSGEKRSDDSRISLAQGSERFWTSQNGEKGRHKLPVIYITGGSSGSHFINTLVKGCVKELLEEFIVIHQTGDAKEYQDFDRLEIFRNSLPAQLKARYYITKFIDPREVGLVLNKADLVVGRSGINTVTELIFFEKPSLLIPLPYSQNNEQIKNAEFLKDRGLAEVFYQGKNDLQDFLEILINMFDNIDRYRAKYKLTRKNLISQASLDAAQKIVEIVTYEARTTKKKTPRQFDAG